MVLRRRELDETQDIAKYAKQLEDIGDQPSVVILQQVLRDERKYYQILNNMISNRRPLSPSSPDQARNALDEILAARREGGPKAAGWIGDAIYGINDGLGPSLASSPEFLEPRWATAKSLSSQAWLA